MGRDAPVADWMTFSYLRTDPLTAWARLRAEGGVHWVPCVGRYFITSYEAARDTLIDQKAFSSNVRNSINVRALGHSFLRRDDPEHHRERELWQPVFRPSAVMQSWTRVMGRNARKYLDEIVAKGRVADLAWDFAAPYTAENLRQILGFHNVTQQDVQRWSQALLDANKNYTDDPDVWARGERAYTEVDVALEEMLAWHAAHGDHSLISTLVHHSDSAMPASQIRANLKATIAGGVHEPRDALGIAAWALLTHPNQRRAVEADPALWPNVFDEALRWEAPVSVITREARLDTEIAGASIPAGAKLAICIHSANRDERVWRNPSSFDIHRDARPHFAFGKGVHTCLGAWVTRAEIATVGLPALFGRLEGLELDPERPAEIEGWAFRGMRQLPVTWSGTRTRSWSQAAADLGSAPTTGECPVIGRTPAPSIAIVGAGPAGCFSAQALRRAMPEARIDVFDQLPVPYGLVRYGVAGDHQGTKSIARQFERVFLHDEVAFHGNVDIGTDMPLKTLRAAFDAVVLATGLHDDATLNIPGSALPGIIGSGRLTRVLNGHPDEVDLPSIGHQVIVVGHGNVAVDVVRLLTRDREGLAGSDIDDTVRDRLVGDIRVVHVVGRSQPVDAKFDAVMLRELAGVPGLIHAVHGLDPLAPPPGKDARTDAVRELARQTPDDARVRLEWWFGLSPVAIEGVPPTGGVLEPDDRSRVRAMRLADTRGAEVRLIADTIVTAVGFRAADQTFIDLGASRASRVEPGLYVAGWLRRGPRGTIPDQRTDARALARELAEDLAAGRLSATKPGRSALGELPQAVDFTGWRRIDHHETARAAPNRVRTKLSSHADLLAAARDDAAELPLLTSIGPEGRERLAITNPVTIAYGTESGNAELVADTLRRRLHEGGTSVETADLADLTPAELDPERLYLLVCSTYGDGELPTNARPFRDALLAERPDLSGLTFAVFGLGDRSYSGTYSRGSELLAEALTTAGATRIGEYGRHDAGGSESATDGALDWLAVVTAEVHARTMANHTE